MTGQGRLAYGVVNYENAQGGSKNGIPQVTGELRFQGGADYQLGSPEYWFSPAIGLGYRQLYQFGQGHDSATGWGYDRRSQYWYIPLSAGFTLPGWNAWKVKPKATVNYLLVGYQDSYLSGRGTGISDAHNKQDSGYGLELEVMFEKAKNGRTVTIGPFVRYWNIDKSDTTVIYQNGVPVFAGDEPHNTTTEAGLRAMLRF